MTSFPQLRLGSVFVCYNTVYCSIMSMVSLTDVLWSHVLWHSPFLIVTTLYMYIDNYGIGNDVIFTKIFPSCQIKITTIWLILINQPINYASYNETCKLFEKIRCWWGRRTKVRCLRQVRLVWCICCVFIYLGRLKKLPTTASLGGSHELDFCHPYYDDFNVYVV